MAAEASTFATLTPTNLEARVAFSDLYERHIAGRQHVDDREQAFRIDPGIERVLTQSPSPRPSTSPMASTGMIWRDHLLLAFSPQLSEENSGWTLGKRRPPAGDHQPRDADLAVCTSTFDEGRDQTIRYFHARFTFSRTTGQLGIALCTSNLAWQLTAGGVQVGKRLHILTTHTVPLSVGPLQDKLQYTGFAQSPAVFCDAQRLSGADKRRGRSH
ncbi:hypothetical protein C8A05DRAFT_43791 [Staphylotrichum tortipilum]|uniref:Uncharacterized protein n=1 Tax=Staphylotrichum tortipilum TaxID=2831512 RepID=A0AAN6RTI2_9PEZI|nr:hypothetical protein C8A05DRAFT_43791 [Staphylotrichum longicolle]